VEVLGDLLNTPGIDLVGYLVTVDDIFIVETVPTSAFFNDVVTTDDIISLVNTPGATFTGDAATAGNFSNVVINTLGKVLAGDLAMANVGRPAHGMKSVGGFQPKPGQHPLPLPYSNGKSNPAYAPGHGTGGVSGGVPAPVIANKLLISSDLVQKILMAGGAVLVLAGGGAVLILSGGGTSMFSKSSRFSPKGGGKHVNVYPHIDYGKQHLSTEIVAKSLDGKKELSIRIVPDSGIQKIKTHGSLVKPD